MNKKRYLKEVWFVKEGTSIEFNENNLNLTTSKESDETKPFKYKITIEKVSMANGGNNGGGRKQKNLPRKIPLTLITQKNSPWTTRI